MGKCKKDVTPLLTHWSYVFLALTHWSLVKTGHHGVDGIQSKWKYSWQKQIETSVAFLGRKKQKKKFSVWPSHADEIDTYRVGAIAWIRSSWVWILHSATQICPPQCGMCVHFPLPVHTWNNKCVTYIQNNEVWIHRILEGTLWHESTTYTINNPLYITYLQGEAQCPDCHRSFKETFTLRRHIREVHLKLKKHTCPVCGNSFARASAMKQHLFYQHQHGPNQ